MATHEPIYRLHVSAPRREAEGEDLVPLTPTAGGVHNEVLRLSTRDLPARFPLDMNDGGGVDDYVISSNITGLESVDEVTVICMVRPRALNSSSAAFFSYEVSPGGSNRILLHVVPDGRLQALIQGSVIATSTRVVTLGRWHHVKLSWRASDGLAVLHVNGVLWASGTGSTSALPANQGTVVVGQEQDSEGGGFDGTQSFDGAVAEVKVWSRFFNRQDWNEQLTRDTYPDNTDLILYWRFPESEATTISDESGTGNDGTVVGSTWLPRTAHPLNFQPYMDQPDVRQGAVDPVAKRTSTGQISVVVNDQRLGAANATRWLTAYGIQRLGGCYCVLDESVDGGTTFAELFAGRLDSPQLQGRARMVLSAQDLAQDLLVDAYVNTPVSSNVTGLLRPPLYPVSLVAEHGYGDLEVQPWIRGELADGDNSAASILINSEDALRGDAFMTSQMRQLNQLALTLKGDAALRARTDVARVRIRRLDTQATGDLIFSGFELKTNPNITDRQISPNSGARLHMYHFYVDELPSGHPDRIAVPANGVDVELYVYPEGRATEGSPMIFVDVHPVQHLKDVLQGHLGRLFEDGTPRLPLRRNEEQLNTLIADTTFGDARVYVDKKKTVQEVLDELCLQFGLAWRMDQFGRVLVEDWRMPASVPGGTPTITNADLDGADPPGWTLDRASALTRIDATYYVDSLVNDAQLKDNAKAGRLETTDALVILMNLSDDFVEENKGELAATAYRTTPGEVVPGKGLRARVIQNKLLERLHEMHAYFGVGGYYTTLPCRRTSNTSALQPGSLALVQVDELPDPGTNVRGGTRFMRVTEVQPDGPRLHVSLFDLGVNTAAAVPTVGTLALVGDRLTVPITVNAAGHGVVIEINVTPQAVDTRPDDADDGWERVTFAPFSGDWFVYNIPRNLRTWARARSQPPAYAVPTMVLPSAWVYPSTGDGFVDGAAVIAPSSLSLTPFYNLITGTFTNNDDDAVVDVYIEEPVGNNRTLVEVLPRGSTFLAVGGLRNATEYRVALIARNEATGGVSGEVSDDATTTGTPPTLEAVNTPPRIIQGVFVDEVTRV